MANEGSQIGGHVSFNVTEVACKLPALYRISTAQQPYNLQLSYQSMIVSVAFDLVECSFYKEWTYSYLKPHLALAISLDSGKCDLVSSEILN